MFTLITMTDSSHGKLGCFYKEVFTWLETQELFVECLQQESLKSYEEYTCFETRPGEIV